MWPLPHYTLRGKLPISGVEHFLEAVGKRSTPRERVAFYSTRNPKQHMELTIAFRNHIMELVVYGR